MVQWTMKLSSDVETGKWKNFGAHNYMLILYTKHSTQNSHAQHPKPNEPEHGWNGTRRSIIITTTTPNTNPRQLHRRLPEIPPRSRIRQPSAPNSHSTLPITYNPRNPSTSARLNQTSTIHQKRQHNKNTTHEKPKQTAT